MRVETSGTANAPSRKPFRLLWVIVGIVITAAAIGVGAGVTWHHASGNDVPSGIPLVSGKSLVWITIGDWGRLGGYAQREVAESMGAAAAAVSASFIVSVGDNFYDAGVSSVDDSQFNESWRDIYTHPALSARPWLVIAGNHDYRGGTPSLRGQIDYSARDPRWRFPALNTTMSYAFGGQPGSDVQFVFVDTCPYIQKYKESPDNPAFAAAMAAADPTAQLAWLEKTLGAAAASPSTAATIVVGHHPIYSGGEHGDSEDLKVAFLPLFMRYGVDAYIAGHDHTLIHLAANGTQFVVSGAGSKIRDNTIWTNETRFFADVAGFTVHSVNASHACHSYMGPVGELLWYTVVPLRKTTESTATA